MKLQKSIYPSTKDYMIKIYRICQKAIELCPEQCLRVSKSKGRFYFRVEDVTSKIRKYLSRKDPQYLLLVKKYCATRILSAMNETTWLSEQPSQKAFDALDKICVWLEDRFGDACPNFVCSRRTILREWQEEPYERNPFVIDDLHSFQTARGEMVRSKTENFIADYFYSHHIPYKLEYPVDVGTRNLYPDFIFVNPANGNIYYLEAFGLMQDPDYVRKSFLCKIRDYSQVGIILGVNLFATFESADVPFDTAGFRRMMERILAM